MSFASGGEGNHRSFARNGARACQEERRIGANNESGQPKAQQRLGVIQIFALRPPRQSARRILARAEQRQKNAYPVLR